MDVSLLSVGAWATGLSVDLSLMSGQPVPQRGSETEGAPKNPIYGQFQTADGRWLQFSMLQPGRYWPEVCRALGREDLITDDRFCVVERLIENAQQAGAIVRDEIRSRNLAELTVLLQSMDAPWAIVQNSLEVGNDPSLRANGYIQSFSDAEGNTRELVTSPVQFDEAPLSLRRAPLFAEHTDEILEELGYSENEILELKVAGAAT